MLAGRKRIDLIRGTIPKAWADLCEGPDELLLELFADKVESLCGHKPEHEELAKYLADQMRLMAETQLRSAPKILLIPPSVVEAPALIPKPGPKIFRQGGYTDTRPVSYTFKGISHSVSTYKEVMMGICRDIHRAHGGEFERVLAWRGRRRAYFSRDSRGMTHPQEIGESGIYAETNFSANDIMDRCYKLLALFDYQEQDLQVKLANDRQN